jgi:hypothetical protein
MRAIFIISLLFVLASSPLQAEEKKIVTRDVDKQVFDVLKEIHNRGADGYNLGDHLGCYRLFQGSLMTVRAVLVHRPAEQKFIDEALAQAEREPLIARRAIMLHEAIEKLRGRLREAPAAIKTIVPERLNNPPREWKADVPPKSKINAEPLDFPPRELKPEQKEPPKPPLPPKDGLMGRLSWKGEPLAGAQIKFVRRDRGIDVAVETKSDPEGRFVMEKVPPGQYSVLLTMPASKGLTLPERYAAKETSPLVVDVKAGGDTIDFVLK